MSAHSCSTLVSHSPFSFFRGGRKSLFVFRQPEGRIPAAEPGGRACPRWPRSSKRTGTVPVFVGIEGLKAGLFGMTQRRSKPDDSRNNPIILVHFRRHHLFR